MKRIEGVGGVTLAVVGLVVAVAIGIAATAVGRSDSGPAKPAPATTIINGVTTTVERARTITNTSTAEPRTNDTRTDDSSSGRGSPDSGSTSGG